MQGRTVKGPIRFQMVQFLAEQPGFWSLAQASSCPVAGVQIYYWTDIRPRWLVWTDHQEDSFLSNFHPFVTAIFNIVFIFRFVFILARFRWINDQIFVFRVLN